MPIKRQTMSKMMFDMVLYGYIAVLLYG
jgi:hypothetical protein